MLRYYIAAALLVLLITSRAWQMTTIRVYKVDLFNKILYIAENGIEAELLVGPEVHRAYRRLRDGSRERLVRARDIFEALQKQYEAQYAAEHE